MPTKQTHSRPLTLIVEQVKAGDLINLAHTGDPYWVEVTGLGYCEFDRDGANQCDGYCDVVLRLARRQPTDPVTWHLRNTASVDVRVGPES
jgi:hypothetical protein